MLEILATVLGLTQGILVMLNKRSNWIIYAGQMAVLVAFSYQMKLYGDMIQNGFFFFWCVFSFFAWGKAECSKITVEDNGSRIVLFLIIALFTLLGGHLLSSTDDPMPYTDSFTTVTTFIAMFLMTTHKVEAWVVWFFNDVAYMYQYFYLPDQALYLFCLYIIWTCLAVGSFVNWLRIYNKQKDDMFVYEVIEGEF